MKIIHSFHLFSLFLTLCFAISVSSVSAQTEITKVKSGTVAEGVVYHLPKTALRFTALTEKTTFTPGEFCHYAEKYLHLQVGMKPTERYALAGLQMTTVGVADTSKCYAVKLKGKSVGANLALDNEGVLVAVNAEPVATPAPHSFVSAPKPVQPNGLHFLNNEARTAGSTAKMAELTAQQLQDLQEHKQLLVTGEAEDMPQDERQLRLMLAEIDRQHAILMTLFTGITTRDTTETVLTYVPDRELSQQVLFRLSAKRGILDSDDLSGAPVCLSLKRMHVTPDSIIAFPAGKKLDGLMVNIPDKVHITVQQGDRQLCEQDLFMGQFGYTDLIGGALFRRFTTHMTLHPATGAVKKLQADIPEK